jgi:hypothetical protein
MELRSFVSKALADIIGAVQDAQTETPPGCIVPSIAKTYKAVEHGISELQCIEFEVTIGPDEEVTGARLNVIAPAVGGRIKGESNDSSGHAATLRFSIPVKLPVDQKTTKKG